MEGNNQKRRSVLKKAGGTLLTIPLTSGVVAGSEEESGSSEDDSGASDSDQERKIIYDKNGIRLTKIDDNNYIVEGDYSEEERKELIDEYVMNNDGPTTQTHSDSGSDGSSAVIDGSHFFVTSDSWAQADNGDLTFEGTVSGSAYLDKSKDYPREVDRIEVSSTLRGLAQTRAASITVPPGYTKDKEDRTATLSGGSDNTSSHTLHHYEGAVTMTAEDCWKGAEQDDAVTFSFNNEDHILGTFIEMDIGHCL